MLFVLFFALTYITARDISISHMEIEYWRNVISGNDLTRLLAEVGNGSAEKWPPVVSSQYASRLSETDKQNQKAFRDLAIHLLRQVEDYEKHLRVLSMDGFVANAQSLLQLRDHIVRNSSYVNWVVADTINRVVFVNISRRIAERKTESAGMVSLMASLRSFKIDLKDLVLMAEGELGGPILTLDEMKGLEEDAVYHKIWTILEPQSSILLPKNFRKAGTYDLLNTLEIAVLLWRYVNTDFQIQTALPFALLYKQNTDVFSLDDNYQKIKKVLGQESLSVESLGAKVFGVRIPASGVSRLFRDVKTNKIDRHLLFSLSPASYSLGIKHSEELGATHLMATPGSVFLERNPVKSREQSSNHSAE